MTSTTIKSKAVKAKRSLTACLTKSNPSNHKRGFTRTSNGVKQSAMPLSSINIVNVVQTKPTQKELRKAKHNARKKKKKKKREYDVESILSKSVLAENHGADQANVSLPLPGSSSAAGSDIDIEADIVDSVAADKTSARNYLKAATPSKYQTNGAKQVRCCFS